jgi:Na+-driven multidrug efflux pump
MNNRVAVRLPSVGSSVTWSVLRTVAPLLIVHFVSDALAGAANAAGMAIAASATNSVSGSQTAHRLRGPGAQNRADFRDIAATILAAKPVTARCNVFSMAAARDPAGQFSI